MPLTDATRGVIGAAELKRMRKGARLINVARGGIIDEQALADAIRDGHIAGAAIDVFTKEPPDPANPLLQLDQVVVTPHLGASTREAQVNVAFDVADQIVEYLAGGTPRYAVNAPTVLPEELARLQPYLDPRREDRLARSPTRRSQAAPHRVQLLGRARGDRHLDRHRARAAGLFAHFTETRVNPVNAKVVATSMGVDVDERHTTRSVDPEASLLVEVIGEVPLLIAGTQFDEGPRITRINDFRVDMQPSGTFLVVTHQDRPGVIAAISTLLARNDVNIAGIELGRDRPRGHAVMLMEIDDPVGADLLEEVRETARLDQLRQVRL